MNKKGNINGILIISLILFLVLILAVMIGIGAIVIDWTADEIMPELADIGVIANPDAAVPTNMSEFSRYTITPLNTVVQAFTWVSGVLYILALIGVLGISYALRFTGQKWLIGLFIAVMFILVVASIFISNIYEDFYNDTGDVGTRLKEHTILSWLTLYSPIVMTVIGFIAGIIIFTGEGVDEAI